jgi:hypothetical protein
METIIYYAYLTGCFPKSVPRATFGNLNPGNITYSIDWHAQFVEDSNPLILLHFNMLMRRELSRVVSGADTVTVASNYSKSLSTILNDASLSYIPIYSIDYQEINGGWRQYPIISKIKDKSVPGNYRYLLQWYDKA